MQRDKPEPSPAPCRGAAIRERVLDAAERLLRDSRPEFSMRDLAAEAEVSFATPFNQFGSKAGILHALSGRRIDTMVSRFASTPHPPETASRVRLAVKVSVAVMLEEPKVNRVVMGWIGAPGASPSQALARSTALWSLALGSDDDANAWLEMWELQCLPKRLALAFRGVLSFWTAGELADDLMEQTAIDIANALLAGSGHAT